MTMQPRTWSSSATSASRTTLWNQAGKSSARDGDTPRSFAFGATGSSLVSPAAMTTPARSSAPFGRGRLRRLVGLDRTAPPPGQTVAGQPLRPFTVPNLVGYLRLAALPVFL